MQRMPTSAISAILTAVVALGLAYEDERGDIKTSIGAVVGGVLTIVVGLVLSNTILSQAATSGASANIGSFSGAQALNDLVPLIYYAVVVLIGVGLMGIGARGLVNN
tara:strand:- start:2384 stop:2704 length:321 start_codon:yes stop_codon:yes gene_type:complete